MRVSEGGHNIPDYIIERRYKKGLKNLFDLYLPIVDGAVIYDNSNGKHEMVAYSTNDRQWRITNNDVFDEIKKGYEKSTQF